jgi:hypothetical protein
MKHIWKLWLRLNLLTKDIDNDYVASVSATGKTLRNADIARILKNAGSKLSYETLRLIARVPELPAGQYTLRVVTRFSQGSVFLTEPRTVEYDRLLIVP